MKIKRIVSSLFMISVLSVLFSLSCGDRPAKEEKTKPETNLVGSWIKAISDCTVQTSDCDCTDTFNFYNDNTFDRTQKCEYTVGSYFVRGDKLELQMATISLLYTYYVLPNSLTLVKSDVAHTYTRKPFKVILAN